MKRAAGLVLRHSSNAFAFSGFNIPIVERCVWIAQCHPDRYRCVGFRLRVLFSSGITWVLYMHSYILHAKAVHNISAYIEPCMTSEKNYLGNFQILFYCLNSIRRSVSLRYAIIFLSLTCGNAARYERAILVIVQYERAILAIVQKDCGRLAVSLHALSPGGRNFLLCNVEWFPQPLDGGQCHSSLYANRRTALVAKVLRRMFRADNDFPQLVT